MKITVHIDEVLLDRVMRAYGYETKTKALAEGLRELDRQAKYRTVVASTETLSPEELKNGVDPAYNIHALRFVEKEAAF